MENDDNVGTVAALAFIALIAGRARMIASGARTVYQKLAQDITYRPYGEESFSLPERVYAASQQFRTVPRELYHINKSKMRRC